MLRLLMISWLQKRTNYEKNNIHFCIYVFAIIYMENLQFVFVVPYSNIMSS